MCSYSNVYVSLVFIYFGVASYGILNMGAIFYLVYFALPIYFDLLYLNPLWYLDLDLFLWYDDFMLIYIKYVFTFASILIYYIFYIYCMLVYLFKIWMRLIGFPCSLTVLFLPPVPIPCWFLSFECVSWMKGISILMLSVWMVLIPHLP